MKRYIFPLFAFLFTISSFGQDANWKLYSSIDGIEIYTTDSDCYAANIPDQKAIIIKVVNTTNDDLTVEWDKYIWYNDKLVTDNVSDNENHFTIDVKKNSSQEGSCDIPRGPFYIYKDFITYKTDTKLSKFELQNITVTRF
jgi:hypothetical protein